MFYAGRNNEAYKKYAQCRNWLHTVDDKVKEITGVSLLDLPDLTVRDWYEEGVDPYEAAAWAILRWLYS